MTFYRETATGYNELHGEEQEHKLSVIKEYLNIKKTDLLLDVGCGTGVSSDFDCMVAGIDPTFELLVQNKNAFCLQGMGEHLPFKDNSFDIVVSVTSLHNFQNFEQGIEEINRVGKQKFVFSVLKKANDFDSIRKEIENRFSVQKIISANQDWVFVCSNQNL